jgi:hypothetical protein
MKYKGENKFYWEIGIFDCWARYGYKRFIFRFLFLKHRPEAVENLRFWRDYIGINYESDGWQYKTL